MAWTNLDNVYVSTNGGIIAGDLKVNGTLTIDDKKGTNTTYDVANQITSLRDSVSQAVSPVKHTTTTEKPSGFDGNVELTSYEFNINGKTIYICEVSGLLWASNAQTVWNKLVIPPTRDKTFWYAAVVNNVLPSGYYKSINYGAYRQTAESSTSNYIKYDGTGACEVQLDTNGGFYIKLFAQKPSALAFTVYVNTTFILTDADIKTTS